jgi:hypothetical protein
VPKESVMAATRRGGGWWWVAAALVGVIAALLVVLLVQGESASPSPSTLPSREAQAAELERLKAEAVAAVHNWIEAIEKVDETADASVLDGVFVPGSELDTNERAEAKGRADDGEVIDPSADFAVVDVKVLEVNRMTAKVTGTTTHTAVIVRNRKTGKVLGRQPPYRRRVEVQLERVDGRWLIAHSTALGNPEFPEGR